MSECFTYSIHRREIDIPDIVVRHCPTLEHVLQHGVVGRRQQPRSLQPLQAQQQRGKENVGAVWVSIEQGCVALATPVPQRRLHRGLAMIYDTAPSASVKCIVTELVS